MADVDSLRRLLTPQGREALELAVARKPDETAFLAEFQFLSRRFPEDIARAAVEQAILRRKAAAKFTSAGRMFFTRVALEQSTSEAVARHRAKRFAGSSLILDLGCGIGGDSLALASMAPVIAVDHDHVGARYPDALQGCQQDDVVGRVIVERVIVALDQLPVIPNHGDALAGHTAIVNPGTVQRFG